MRYSIDCKVLVSFSLAPHSTRLLRLLVWPPNHLDDLGWPNLNYFDVHGYKKEAQKWFDENKFTTNLEWQRDIMRDEIISMDYPSPFPITVPRLNLTHPDYFLALTSVGRSSFTMMTPHLPVTISLLSYPSLEKFNTTAAMTTSGVYLFQPSSEATDYSRI